MVMIDILNKIANDELPDKTLFRVYPDNNEDVTYFICRYDKSYPGDIFCIGTNEGEYNAGFGYHIDHMRILNYEVEIIEDDKTIIEKLKTKEELYENCISDLVDELVKYSCSCYLREDHEKTMRYFKDRWGLE